MFNKTRMRLTPIGLDIGSTSFKAVQLGLRRGAYELRSATTVHRESRTEITPRDIARLNAALRRQGFVGSKLVVACDPSQLHSAMLELPPIAGGTTLAKIAEVEMRRACSLENAEIEMSWWDLPAPIRQSSSTSVMAVATVSEQTRVLAELFEADGLDIVAVDTVPTALSRACSTLCPEGLSMVADLGIEAATIALISGGQVVYYRNISEFGIGSLRRSVADDMRLAEEEVDCVLQECGLVSSDSTSPSEFTPHRSRLRGLVLRHVEAIAGDLESSMTFAKHKYTHLRLNDLFICGSGAAISGIEENLSQRLGITVTAAVPARIATVPEHLSTIGNSPRHLIASGLAMNPEAI